MKLFSISIMSTLVLPGEPTDQPTAGIGHWPAIMLKLAKIGSPLPDVQNDPFSKISRTLTNLAIFFFNVVFSPAPHCAQSTTFFVL